MLEIVVYRYEPHLNKKGRSSVAKEPRQLSLGWQFLILVVCVYLGIRLSARFGENLANLLGIDWVFGRGTIEVFFAAIVAIVGVCAYRGVQLICRSDEKKHPKA